MPPPGAAVSSVAHDVQSDVRGRGPVTSRRVVRARRGPHLASVALLLLTLQAGLRTWAGLRGSLQQDDLVYEHRAAAGQLDSVYELFTGYHGHLMPGGFLLVRLITAVAPLEVWPTVLMAVVLQAGTGLLLLALLRELFGDRRAVLVPLALFVLSPVTLPGSLWWAAALNQLPAMLALVGLLLLHVRYLRSGRVATGLWAPVVLAVGLLFYEKLLLAVPLVLVLTAGWFVGGRWWERPWRTLRLHARVWAGWLAVLAVHLGLYVGSVDSTVGRPRVGTVLRLLGRSVQGLHTAVLGGPWTWSSSEPTATLPAAPSALSVVAWVVLGLVVGGSVVAVRGAAKAWALPLGWLLATVALLAGSRTGYGTLIALAYRYFSEVALLAALALGLAFLPLAGSVAAGEVQRVRARSWAPPVPRAGVTVALVLVLAASAVSTASYARSWRHGPGGQWLPVARAAALADPGTSIADTDVPPALVDALLGAQVRKVSYVLAPVAPKSQFLTTGTSSADLAAFDGSGHLHPALVDGVHALPGPRPGCGWLATGPAGTSIALRSLLFDYDWTVRIGYVASADTTAVVTVGSEQVPVQLHRGLHAVFVQVTSAVVGVQLSGLAPGVSACTDDVVVGTPRSVQPPREGTP